MTKPSNKIFSDVVDTLSKMDNIELKDILEKDDNDIHFDIYLHSKKYKSVSIEQIGKVFYIVSSYIDTEHDDFSPYRISRQASSANDIIDKITSIDAFALDMYNLIRMRLYKLPEVEETTGYDLVLLIDMQKDISVGLNTKVSDTNYCTSEITIKHGNNKTCIKHCIRIDDDVPTKIDYIAKDVFREVHQLSADL